eukprot:scaffold33183_cov146-Isochrysis_galbana.AAC.1
MYTVPMHRLLRRGEVVSNQNQRLSATLDGPSRRRRTCFVWWTGGATTGRGAPAHAASPAAPAARPAHRPPGGPAPCRLQPDALARARLRPWPRWRVRAWCCGAAASAGGAPGPPGR